MTTIRRLRAAERISFRRGSGRNSSKVDLGDTEWVDGSGCFTLGQWFPGCKSYGCPYLTLAGWINAVVRQRRRLPAYRTGYGKAGYANPEFQGYRGQAHG